jgi:hypothetical protein
MNAKVEAALPVGNTTFLLCLLWCGAGMLYLLLPKVRRPFFSRRRGRY